jgi:probable rRNA maturation factor
MSPTIDIAVESPDWDDVDAQSLAEQVFGAAIDQSGVKLTSGAEISILLCNDAFIRDLNHKWRGIDKATNVLSFPSGEPIAKAQVLGDIVIAFETLKREAEEEGKSFRDHFAHLLAHGFLHLIGHDHLVEAEAERMEALERQVLAALGIDDPYRGALASADVK